MDPSRQEPPDPQTSRHGPSPPDVQPASPADPPASPSDSLSSLNDNLDGQTLSLRPGRNLAAEVRQQVPPPESPSPAASVPAPAPENPIPAADLEDLPEVKTLSLRFSRKTKQGADNDLPVARLVAESDAPPTETISFRAGRRSSAPTRLEKRPIDPPLDPLEITPPPAPSLVREAPETADESDEDGGVSAIPVCPRCNARLINPASLGLCPECGYCRLLEEGKQREKDKEKQEKKQRPSFLGVVEFCELMTRLPSWLWILLTGLVVITALTFRADASFEPNSPGRGLWSVTQLLVGMVMFLAAQLWALVLIAPYEERIGPKDLFLMSRKLWVGAFRRLPETRWPIWLVCWGVATVALDLAVIGGLAEEIRNTAGRIRREMAQARIEQTAQGSAPAPEPDRGPSGERRAAVWANLAVGSATGVAGWLTGTLPWFSADSPPDVGT